MFLFTESEASWEEWWTYDGISGEFPFFIVRKNESLANVNIKHSLNYLFKLRIMIFK